MIKTTLTIILFILMMTVIISIHEFGHFITAKLFNVYIYEYSIGMGKKLFSKKGKETVFSIRLLPIGGYCSLAGDNDTDLENNPEIDVDPSTIPNERTLNGIAKWKKIIILLAGVFMNFVLALFIIAIVYLSIGTVSKAPEPIIKEVISGYPAKEAGLLKDDRVIEMKYDNGYALKPSNFSDLSSFLSVYDESYGEVTLIVDRQGEIIEIKVTPVLDESSSSQRYVIGVNSYDYKTEKINIFNCFSYAFSYLVLMTKLIWTTLIGLLKGVGLNNISGPIGIYKATSDAVSSGFTTYLSLAGILSLNIGIFNLLPIPALDGGRVLLTVIEAIIRRPIPKKIENVIMTISVLLFILLMVYATGVDIFRLFRG